MKWYDTLPLPNLPESEGSGSPVSGDVINLLEKQRYYGKKAVPPNGAVTISVTLNASQVAALGEIAEQHGYKNLDPVMHLAVREFIKREGVMWHEGMLRVSIGDVR